MTSEPRTDASLRRTISARIVTLLGALMLLPSPAVRAACDVGPVALQVLGSGGPFGYGRASSGYLLWIDGAARVMVDAGGGTFTRFHEAGARVDDLELLALSHFHPDHSVEVPALLWIKPTDLLISGPTGGRGYPSADDYVDGLFGPGGVFRAVTDGQGLRTVTIDVNRSEPTEVLANASMHVHGLGVPHGIVPAVGYRVDVGDVSVAFSSDQNGSDSAFVEFASGVDVLVVHVAVPETATGVGANLHAKPSVWGQIATDADVGTLVLSHLSSIAPRSADGEIEDFDAKLAHVRSRYQGPLVIAEDLTCVPVSTDHSPALLR